MRYVFGKNNEPAHAFSATFSLFRGVDFSNTRSIIVLVTKSVKPTFVFFILSL